MKTTENRVNNRLDTQLYYGINIWGNYLIITTLMLCFLNSKAQNVKQVITISGAQFTNLLIEKWTNEYSRVNSDITFKFVKSSTKNRPTDLKLTVNPSGKSDVGINENLVNVGRLAVLPVTNEKNTLFTKQLKNGIKQEELKNIFLHNEVSLISDGDKIRKGEPLYTVYTQTPQSVTVKVLVNHFGLSTTELNGIVVTGDDKYLIESVLEDSTGVTFSNLGLIYDLTNRTPLRGIKIIPINLDNSGRLNKEALIYDNLDHLIIFLESSLNKTIPTEDICLSYNSKNNNPIVTDFVNWVTISGQQYNRQFGFLKTVDDKVRAFTQK